MFKGEILQVLALLIINYLVVYYGAGVQVEYFVSICTERIMIGVAHLRCSVELGTYRYRYRYGYRCTDALHCIGQMSSRTHRDATRALQSNQ